MLFLYYYRAINGYEMPSTFVGTLEELERHIPAESVTPLVKAIDISDKVVREAVKEVLSAQLTTTPKREIGLIHSLGNCLEVIQVNHNLNA